MNPTARISLLLGALVLLVFGVVCLKQQLGPGKTPPAFVPPGSDGTSGGRSGFSGQQPTIFSADPIGGQDSDTSPRMREISPVPLEGPSAATFEYPVNTSRPDAPREIFPVPGVSAETDPSASDPSASDLPENNSGAPRPTPIDLLQPATGLRIPAQAPPSTVTTAADDSLWAISQRVYGRGDYYKALYLHNRALLPRPDRIAAGTVLNIPAVEWLQQQFPDACPGGVEPPKASRGG